MRYTPHTSADQERMLRAIGLASVEELYQTYSDSLRSSAKIDLPDGLTELAVHRRLSALAAKNADCFGLEFLSRRRHLPSFYSQRRRRDRVAL